MNLDTYIIVTEDSIYLHMGEITPVMKTLSDDGVYIIIRVIDQCVLGTDGQWEKLETFPKEYFEE